MLRLFGNKEITPPFLKINSWVSQPPNPSRGHALLHACFVVYLNHPKSQGGYHTYEKILPPTLFAFTHASIET